MDQRTECISALVAHLESGGSLRSWCALPGNPSASTVRSWASASKEIGDALRIAEESRCDAIAEECLAIADEEPVDSKGQVDSSTVAWARLRVDTRMRLLSKWSRRYGDKVQVGGDDSGRPIVLTDAERAAKIESLMQTALERQQRVENPPAITDVVARERSVHLHDHTQGDWHDDGS